MNGRGPSPCVYQKPLSRHTGYRRVSRLEIGENPAKLRRQPLLGGHLMVRAPYGVIVEFNYLPDAAHPCRGEREVNGIHARLWHS